MNIAQWYAFKFFFTTSHYEMAYIAAGAVVVHIGVKLPVIRRALGEPLDTGVPDTYRGMSRRTVLRGTWLAVGVATHRVIGYEDERRGLVGRARGLERRGDRPRRS
jgi:hypothetical protein